MNDPSSLDSFGRHLATILTTVDLAARVVPPHARPAASDLLSLSRAAVGARRVSLFRVRGVSGDDDEPLVIVRLARVEATRVDDEAVDFREHAASLLLSCLGSGASEAVGPIGEAEPFRASHRAIEPDTSAYAVFVPVAHAGIAFGVLEATRDDRAFSGEEIALLEAAGRAAVSAVFLAEREDTIAALLVSLLDPAVKATSLRARIRSFLERRRSTPEERRALVVAASIAELSRHSSRALALADDVLEAIHRSLSPAGDGVERGAEEP